MDWLNEFKSTSSLQGVLLDCGIVSLNQCAQKERDARSRWPWESRAPVGRVVWDDRVGELFATAGRVAGVFDGNA